MCGWSIRPLMLFDILERGDRAQKVDPGRRPRDGEVWSEFFRSSLSVERTQPPPRALRAASRSLRLCGAGDLPDTAARAAAMFGSSCSGCVGRSSFAFAVAASAEARSLAAASCMAFNATVMLLVALVSPAARRAASA